MFSNLLPDPTLLFRFKIDVHRLPRIQDVQDVTTWGLNDLHQLPPIGQFNCGAGPMRTKLGWNPQGLFIAWNVRHSSHILEPNPWSFQANISVNSRYDSSVLRENEFCSGFHFYKDRGAYGKRVRPGGEKELTELQVGVRGKPSTGLPTEGAEHGLSRGWMQPFEDGLSAWFFIDAHRMPGYRPEEFPDIGLNYNLMVVDSESSGCAFHWFMVHASGNPHGNPSLWTQCRLVSTQ